MLIPKICDFTDLPSSTNGVLNKTWGQSRSASVIFTVNKKLRGRQPPPRWLRS